MERISIIPGKLPILLVAPHGFDENDERTALITEKIANSIGAYAVINHGWERNDTVDFMLDKADCNNVEHCHEDVVKEEFLDPILRYKARILMKYPTAYVFFIHGMSNKHRFLSKGQDMEMVIGFGAGSPNSYTCDLWRKDAFIYLLNNAAINTYQGSKGGPMSGWSRNNMNQLFRKWYPEDRVQSMQIEIIHELREDDEIAIITADYLAEKMLELLLFSSESWSRKTINREY